VVVASVQLDDGSVVQGRVSVPVTTDLRWSPLEVAAREGMGVTHN
jgi:hypothetical protein